jgi:hypothetical protein
MLSEIRSIARRVVACSVAVVVALAAGSVRGADEPPVDPDNRLAKPGQPPAVARLLDDLVVLSSVPLRWEREEWRRFSALAGVTLALTAVDEDIQRWTQRDRLSLWEPGYDGGVREELIDLGGWLGQTETVAGISGLLYVSGRFAGDSHLQQTGELAVESLVVTALVVELVKRVVDRQRPSGQGVDSSWGPSYRASPRYSFPSGHAAATFALATVVARQYPEKRWVAPVAYGLATLTAASRVAENRHWTSDVVAGACLGVLISDVVVRRSRERGIRVLPHVSPNGTGIAVSWRF